MTPVVDPEGSGFQTRPKSSSGIILVMVVSLLVPWDHFGGMMRGRRDSRRRTSEKKTVEGSQSSAP